MCVFTCVHVVVWQLVRIHSMWFPRVKVRSSGLLANPYTHWAISSALKKYFKSDIQMVFFKEYRIRASQMEEIKATLWSAVGPERSKDGVHLHFTGGGDKHLSPPLLTQILSDNIWLIWILFIYLFCPKRNFLQGFLWADKAFWNVLRIQNVAMRRAQGLQSVCGNMSSWESPSLWASVTNNTNFFDNWFRPENIK